MNAIELKRVEFRHYLETSGVMDALSYALIKLYDETVKPSNPVAFVRQNFKTADDEDGEIVSDKTSISDLDALELIKKLKEELEKARQEILTLRNTLEAMTRNVNGLSPEDEQEFHEFQSNSKYNETLTKKYLTIELFQKLCELKTTPTIIDCIKKSTLFDFNLIGVVPLDAKCYTNFAIIFNSIIADYNCVASEVKQPVCTWGDWNEFEKIDDPSIISIKMSCRRTIDDYPFVLGMNEQQFEDVLTKVQNVIQTNYIDDKEIDGAFYKITDITENEPIFQELQTFGLAFKSMDSAQNPLWPMGRGLYIDNNRNLSILINEEDHLRFISTQRNGDFGAAYQTLVCAVRKFSEPLEFVRHEKFGWLTMCLSHLGTALQCEIQLKFLRIVLVSDLNEICEKFQLHVKEIEHTENECVLLISNKRAYGLSEFDCVKTVYYGAKEILRWIHGGNDGKDIEADAAIADENDEKEAENNETEECNPVENPDDENETEKIEEVDINLNEIANDIPAEQQEANSITSNGTYTKEVEEVNETTPPKILSNENVEIDNEVDANGNDQTGQPNQVEENTEIEANNDPSEENVTQTSNEAETKPE